MGWPTTKANERQKKLILFLLDQLGYVRPAQNTEIWRVEYGLSQKQARGSLTFDDASDLIDRLKADLEKKGSLDDLPPVWSD